MPQHPDHYCQTGPNEAGINYFVWDCFNNERVVIRNWSTAFMSLPATKETASCGYITEFEKTLKNDTSARCDKKSSPWITHE